MRIITKYPISAEDPLTMCPVDKQGYYEVTLNNDAMKISVVNFANEYAPGYEPKIALDAELLEKWGLKLDKETAKSLLYNGKNIGTIIDVMVD